MASSSMVVLLIALSAHGCDAFLSSPWTMPRQVRISPPSAYRDEWGEGGRRSSNERDDEAALKRVRTRGQYLPVIGPIPNGLPLIVGGEMTLDPPTPLQWQALEESVVLHREYLKQQNSTAITGIDAAPLVAIIDNVTGKSPSGRYATLAAVVGISASSKSKKSSLETADETSFMESLSRLSSERSPLSSRIRLVGVGRAKLKDFFYKLPTSVDDDDDDDDDNEDIDNEDEMEMDVRSTPIIMAEFNVLKDSSLLSSADESNIGQKGARSAQSSPVHAIAEMTRVANRVIRLHDDRRRLVTGLTAAKSRLDNAFEDHDGIGRLSQDQEIIDDFLNKYQGVAKEDDADPLAPMPNYGLNYYSAFSSILDLTNAALELFEPYYSPGRRDTEEYRLEIMSFVAFRALDGFCTPEDKAWALQCTNSLERLDRAYDIMWLHKELLERKAEQLSNDLRLCGEECTDLW